MNTVSKGDTPKRPAALEEAIRLLHAGLWPVAITPPGKKTKWVADPGKQPIGKAWGVSRPTEATLEAFWAKYPDAGLGLKLGCKGKMIDIECDDPEKGEDSYTTLMGGECIETLGWFARRGAHHAFAWDDRLAKYGRSVIKIPELPGLEIRIGDLPGKDSQLQSVCPPSPITVEHDAQTVSIGFREWNGVQELAPLPEHFFTILDKYLSSKTKKNPPQAISVKSPDDACDLALSVDLLEYVDANDYDSWIQAGMALHDRFRGSIEALMIWDRWSKTSAKYEEGEPTRKWAGFESDGGVRFGTLIALAKASGYTGAKEAKEANKGLTLSGHTKTTGAKEAKEANKAPVVAGTIGPQHEEEDAPVVIREWPAPPGADAWYGPAGQIARAVEPYTEADPTGILVQLLIGFGNLIGRKPCFYVGPTRHGLNENVCTVGRTAAGRKGTAKDVAMMVLGYADETWKKDRVRSGLSSGEGLIWEVRDPIYKTVPDKKKGLTLGYKKELADEGVSDKRILVIESEFGGTLKVLSREGNTLSARMREAWDDGNLRAMTKNNQTQATDAHISIIGHVTEPEVIRHLSETDAANGFANRFLWVCVQSSKRLSRGTTIPRDVYIHLADVIKSSFEKFRNERDEEIVLVMRQDAALYWDELYNGPLAVEKPGLLGAIVGRAAPHIMRLACIYAAIDGSYYIELVHLKAAWALWQYCERSAARIFGDNLGDRDAESVLAALRSNPAGLTQTQIMTDVFRGHRNRMFIGRVLGRLLEARLIRSEVIPTAGRPRTVWHAIASQDNHAPLSGSLLQAAEWLKKFLHHRPMSDSQVFECGAMPPEQFTPEQLADAAAVAGVSFSVRDGVRYWSVQSSGFGE